MAVTIYDIAKLAGVSIATISRIVNNNPGVSDKTRTKVLAVMKENNYTPNPFARSLQLDTMRTIGISCSDISDEYMARSVSEIEKKLHEYGYDYLLFCSGYKQDSKEYAVDLLIKKKIDALLLIGSGFMGTGTEEDVAYLHKAAKSVPVFMINGYLKDDNIFCVLHDDAKAMYEATEKLILSGRSRILFLYNSDSYSARQKMVGYEAALRDKHLPVDGNLKLKIKGTVQEERDILLLRRDISFDAAVATTDELAIGVLKYAKAKMLKVPQDISVIGYNNSLLADCVEPELTSVDSAVRELSQTAIVKLMECIRGEKVARKTLIRGQLIRRCTTDF